MEEKCKKQKNLESCTVDWKRTNMNSMYVCIEEGRKESKKLKHFFLEEIKSLIDYLE
jgi:hypothetical protein